MPMDTILEIQLEFRYVKSNSTHWQNVVYQVIASVVSLETAHQSGHWSFQDSCHGNLISNQL